MERGVGGITGFHKEFQDTVPALLTVPPIPQSRFLVFRSLKFECSRIDDSFLTS